MELHDLYLMHGVFFQNHSLLDRACLPGVRIVAVLRKHGVVPFLYGGILERDPNRILGDYTGHILDGFGRAGLEHVYMTGDHLSFTKVYESGRPHSHPISYTFRRVRDFHYAGEYCIEEVGMRGQARCILTPVESEFFSPSAYQPLSPGLLDRE